MLSGLGRAVEAALGASSLPPGRSTGGSVHRTRNTAPAAYLGNQLPAGLGVAILIFATESIAALTSLCRRDFGLLKC